MKVRMNLGWILWIGMGLILSSGCAVRKNMALRVKMEDVDLSKESIAILTLQTENANKGQCFFPPSFIAVGEWKNGKMPKDYQYMFIIRRDQWNWMEGEYQSLRDVKPNPKIEYAVSMSLRPGRYRLMEAAGQTQGISATGDFGGAFMAQLSSRARFEIPLYLDFEVKANEIVYLGHIQAIYRKRQSKDELKAGGVLPLLDQAFVNLQDSTFDIQVRDRQAEDKAIFVKMFPVLKNQMNLFQKRLIPEWKKPKAGDMMSVIGR